MSEPRSELRLRDLGREAEYAVDLPDLGGLERRGRALRFRRQAGVVAAAVVVATTSLFLFQDRSDRVPTPAPNSPEPVDYPGNTMQILPAGTYEITASADGADATVIVTLPEDWNAAEGPNRFPYLPGKSNDDSLEKSQWSVGLLALKVSAVAGQACQDALAPGDAVEGMAQTVAALSALPGAEVVGTPRDEARFGYPATQVRVVIDARDRCEGLSAMFESDLEGKVGVRSGTSLDVWVVDVKGTTLVVVAGTRGDVPEQYADELASVVGSLRLALPE
jgi:hypothetical protein